MNNIQSYNVSNLAYNVSNLGLDSPDAVFSQQEILVNINDPVVQLIRINGQDVYSSVHHSQHMYDTQSFE